jgi:hypothetical protein
MPKPELPDLADRQRNNAVALRQANEAIEETTVKREGLLRGDGDLVEIRRLGKRIDDLKADADALSEQREWLASEAEKVARDKRLAEADLAIATLRPGIEEIIAKVETLEATLIKAGDLHSEITKRFEVYSGAYPKALPRLPAYSDFSLNGFSARLKQCLEDCARDGFQHIANYADQVDLVTGARKRPSVLLRERAEAFLADVRAKVHELEQPVAAE